MRRLRKSAGCSVLALLFLLGTLSIPVHAAFGYSGPLDAETGEPESGSSDDDTTGEVTVSDDATYDRERQGYLYTVGDSARILCSAADGMIVQDPVSVEADTGVDLIIYKDGTVLDSPDLSNLSETGGYVVEADVGGQKYQAISFTIAGEYACNILAYTMPDGFSITGATLDDEPIGYENSYVSMAEEGHYVIDYSCDANSKSYELDLTVDTTPPVLALSELNEKNQARGPVSIADVEEGASIGITLDGRQISYTSELTESGEYQITLMDQAGNITHYAFTILVYFDLNSWLLLLVFAGIIAAVAIYIIVSRKKLTVR